MTTPHNALYPKRPSHHPAGGLVALACAALLAAAALRCVAGCSSPITPAQEATGLQIAKTVCSFEAGIPVAGPFLVLACPAEIAGLQAALDREVVAPPTSGSSQLAVGPDGGHLLPEALGAPRMLVRRGVGVERALVHAGWCPAGTLVATCDGLQRQLLTAPRVVVLVADAGAEGGGR